MIFEPTVNIILVLTENNFPCIGSNENQFLFASKPQNEA